ncbi:hypothetical protein AURDEDRAFT_175499 [Auricularia subglabra TFB-10046 SS5]|uniref:phytol kinase n=1 Tax=Auricularia subglabra (strain TFB-10046 / SS5) TaxID=717982 RepID=J0CXD7_AURST|nr:hypothetical protein AURDEDRAFT_175499 [Auricularia subglabra TFB-10046 SS5]
MTMPANPYSHNLAAAAVAFTSQLQDTTRPSICPRCFAVFTEALWVSVESDTVENMLVTHHKFWSACARMACAPGAGLALSPLRPWLWANVTVCRTRHHNLPGDALADDASCLMDALCRCMCVALGITGHRRRKNFHYAKNRSWPLTLEEVMPGGINTYVRWACMLPTAWGLAIVSRLTALSRAQVIDDLLQIPSRLRLLATILRALQGQAFDVTVFAPEHHALITHDVPLRTPTISDSAEILSQVQGMIVVLCNGPGYRADDLATVALGYELTLRDALLGTVGRNVYSADEDAMLVHAANRLTPPPARPSVNRAEAVRLYLARQSELITCSGPACHSYVRNVEERRQPLSACSRCKFVRYCSRDCQRRDWNNSDSRVSHKTACPVFCKLAEIGILHRAGSGFARPYAEQLTDEERSILLRLAQASGVLSSRMQHGLS